MVTCHNCKGNGYVKLRFECETVIEQCKVCNSSGEVKEEEYFHQSWDDGAGYLPSTTVRRLTSKETKALKTTKFIESRPIYNVKKGNIPPF